MPHLKRVYLWNGIRSTLQAHVEKDRLYLETVEQVLSRGRKIIQPRWKGSGSVDLWISGKAGAPVAVDNVLPQEEGVPGIAPQNNPGQEREED